MLDVGRIYQPSNPTNGCSCAKNFLQPSIFPTISKNRFHLCSYQSQSSAISTLNSLTPQISILTSLAT